MKGLFKVFLPCSQVLIDKVTWHADGLVLLLVPCCVPRGTPVYDCLDQGSAQDEQHAAAQSAGEQDPHRETWRHGVLSLQQLATPALYTRQISSTDLIKKLDMIYSTVRALN